MKKKKFNKKLVSDTTFSIFTSIIILIGSITFSYNYIKEKKLYAYNVMQINITEEIENKKKEHVEKVEADEKVDESIGIDEYIGYIEIPQIELNKGFLRKESSHNNVEENLYVLNEADYPNVKNGNFVVAAHSGTGWKAFFNELYRLRRDDYIYVTFNHKKYTYKIDNIYKQTKDGTVNLYRDPTQNTMTLITCTNNDDKTQTLYVAYLIKKEKI